MQLVFNDKVFNVTSFSETLNTQENELGEPIATFTVFVHVSYAETLEDYFIPYFPQENVNFEIKDNELPFRAYDNFRLSQITQDVSGSHQISTTFQFIKN